MNSIPANTMQGAGDTPRRRATIVDVHTHLWDSTSQLGPTVAQSLRDAATTPWERADASVTIFEEAMEPVECAIVLGFESQHLGASIPAQQIADYVARNPKKYLGFAGIDPTTSTRMDDLERAIDLEFVGITISPGAQHFHPCHTGMMQLYERCEERGLAVFCHAGTHFGPTTNLEFAQPHLLDEAIRAFPNLPLVIGQVGHPWLDQCLTLIGKHRHAYADLSYLTSQPWLLYNTLVRAYECGVIDKLLFGSDFPFNTPEEAIVAIYSINTLTQGTLLPTIPREQLRGIVERDALSCLGINKPTGDSGDPSEMDPHSRSDAPADESPVVVVEGAGTRSNAKRSSHETAQLSIA